MDGDPTWKRFLFRVEVAAMAALVIWSLFDRPVRWLLSTL